MSLGPTDDKRPDDHPTLGALLQAARQASGLTVQQVSATTRIRATLIHDLESDNFGSSGAAIYARGHVRAIAAAVGADATPLVARFNAERGGPPPVPVGLVVPVAQLADPSSFSAVLSGRHTVAREPRGPRWGTAVAVAAAVLAVVTAVGYTTGPKGNPADLSARPEVPNSASPSPQAVRTPDPESVASKPAVTGAQLRIRAIGGASWISISNASGTLFEGVLTDGKFKDFTDPARLKVIVGYAPAVNLNCGGRDSGLAGTSRNVRTFFCSASGLIPA